MGRAERNESLWERDSASSQPAGEPVMYPDGEFVFIAVGVGMAMGVVAGYSADVSRGSEGQDLLGYTLLGGLIGGSAAMIGAGAGAGVAAGYGEGVNLAMVNPVHI